MTPPATAYAMCLRWLTLRSRSEAYLRQRLQRKGCDDDNIEQALHRCRELGYIDDQRYAIERAGQLMRQGRAVGIRLHQELHKDGINEHLATLAIDQCRQEYNEQNILADLVERRYANVDFSTIDQRQQRRVVNYLQRRGFPLAMILNHLKNKS
ncbi:MAG: regulatory protein RecX [Thermodesulfobacteriota bacterium]|nr:regulatory protein RecX [Thermodesulfobacteriota bacterium]